MKEYKKLINLLNIWNTSINHVNKCLFYNNQIQIFKNLIVNKDVSK